MSCSCRQRASRCRAVNVWSATSTARKRSWYATSGHSSRRRGSSEGGNANVGLWARSDAAFAWLRSQLTIARFKELVREARDLEVQRYELPNLRALNFVVVGLLGEGVASTTRMDPQAKSLGEYLRAKLVDIPVALLGDRP